MFRDRLDLPVKPLQRLESELDAGAIGDAADSVLGYLENDNPFFLTYRFGYREGGAMKAGMAELRDLARWADGQGLLLSVTPVRRYRRDGTEEWVEERGAGEAHAW